MGLLRLFEVSDDVGALGCFGDSESHLVARDHGVGVAEPFVERVGVPSYTRCFEFCGIVEGWDGSGFSSEDAAQARSLAIGVDGVTTGAAFLEDDLSTFGVAWSVCAGLDGAVLLIQSGERFEVHWGEFCVPMQSEVLNRRHFALPGLTEDFGLEDMALFRCECGPVRQVHFFAPVNDVALDEP